MRCLMVLISVLLGVMLGGGCASGVRASDDAILRAVRNGDHGIAKSIALRERAANLRDKRYLLDQELVLWTALAEGDMPVATRAADDTYDFLRLQGVNAGTEGARFFVGDQAARTWKGEPFEQAAALAAIAAVDGVKGDWGNMRASALSATFQLRELAVVEAEGEGEVRFVASDFEIAHALAALGARELGLREEMEEALRDLAAINPELGGLAGMIRSGAGNTAFIVDYGSGPERIASGEDGSVAAYRERTPSDSAELVVTVNGRAGVGFPVVTDYNRLAFDLKWTSLEAQRRAKSAIGTGLVYGGIGVAAISDDSGAQLAGLGAALAGLALKATAAADTRQCVAVPQRTYLALVDVPHGAGFVKLGINGHPDALIELPMPADAGVFTLHYVRLPTRPNARTSVVYANDAWGSLEQPTLPWVLGGRCVRVPTYDLVREYRQAGLPEWVTRSDLLAMYEEEGIAISGIGAGVPNGVHILEGGDALYTPVVGSAGFVRLFCRQQPSYVPSGEMAIRILEDVR